MLHGPCAHSQLKLDLQSSQKQMKKMLINVGHDLMLVLMPKILLKEKTSIGALNSQVDAQAT